jgi:hypothetical protein
MLIPANIEPIRRLAEKAGPAPTTGAIIPVTFS